LEDYKTPCGMQQHISDPRPRQAQLLTSMEIIKS